MAKGTRAYRFMAKGTRAYRFCTTLLEETKWCNRSSLTTQPETLLSLHGVQVLGGTNIRNDGSKTGSSFIRPASPVNRSMAYRSFTEPKIASTLYKTGPSFERRTHHGGQVLGVQVHGIAGAQVTLSRSTSSRRCGLCDNTFHDPFVLADRRILGV
ncbi:hypothetical protein ACQJBY_039563 [Aegilops geniculata]